MDEPLREKAVLMDGARMERTLARMAAEILERHPQLEGTVLVGVRSRGVPLAQRLAGAIAKASGSRPPVGALDISLYRDDFTTVAPQPITKGTEIPFTIDGRTVVLVDDVLYTGRTVRCALDELIDFGRPSRIELAVLVDRGHRELPIRADYVGRTLATSREEMVQVLLEEEDGRDGVVLRERTAGKLQPKAAGKARAGAPVAAKGKGESRPKRRGKR
ncbi:MAG TPA: bifunctional pyr operon transcriptional regulator/uracil phosphoribosyltransferase PyrR [Vicinamibacteria bacterium]|nr:bifunctional pyr operon transcriptional regulator/uracil phosphoribosyltransferase PyrR [Vicinamibacteria bacterium]